MALRIRLARFGRSHHPIYRIVVMDAKSPREGKYVDILGTYDPIRKDLQVKEEKVKDWLSKGAEITDRAKSLLRSAKIL
ncbi:ribosomal protein S16 [Hydrogenobacter thermophilus TK-6]|uniref:Small ribosomal subunit protein bS16 n=1 Tax=Hydrogenobacter thermophilus (strain DSM 6534 / IAM 12695 / TK-6) TaxID=608538 RepID=D3DJZ6_HYDTT|nr:30S ribosomal protein S16 [Hydrogenobacter thermophilus]ADO46069.1 ribosomal protein S16 [Hydrogenobacter thermophilus TK-6]BAI70148.1 ribosomal protein S16 [Hydrogenobacter thermophilus TK-6]